MNYISYNLTAKKKNTSFNALLIFWLKVHFPRFTIAILKTDSICKNTCNLLKTDSIRKNTCNFLKTF
jgi:hypothetical protein